MVLFLVYWTLALYHLIFTLTSEHTTLLNKTASLSVTVSIFSELKAMQKVYI